MDTLRCIPWERRADALDSTYDLVINLEDELETAAFVKRVRHRQLFGSYMNDQQRVQYTDDARAWFDLSLISVHGRKGADELKLQNRRTYQDLIFEGLGFKFEGQEYLLPKAAETDISGDVAIAPVAGAAWPMKNWAYYDELQRQLQAAGLRVNVLPRRQGLLQHIADIASHRCLVSGDSLPMHLALGIGTPCVTIFNCTSPWEIWDYGRQTKIVSPFLAEYFYKRHLDPKATSAIRVELVLSAVLDRIAGRGHHPQIGQNE
jgi:ADP-heptose:LPS heptosyltransferase